ncbi:MAG: integrase core domain-containing protein, partial [Hydrogenophaga sp.]|nr:integrase core domain-containing protein [Hydrogenophaga sp.]
FQSKAQARMAVFTWIEGWYNPRRRHSSLGYLSPLNFERSNEALCDVVEDADVHVETTPETV